MTFTLPEWDSANLRFLDGPGIGHLFEGVWVCTLYILGSFESFPVSRRNNAVVYDLIP